MMEDERERMKKRLSKMADGKTIASILKQAMDMTIKDMSVPNKVDIWDK